MSLIPKTHLSQYRGKNILITGADGFLGTALFEALKLAHCNILLLSHSKIGKISNNWSASVKYIVGDITDKSTWEKILPGKDLVFHLAAYEHQRGSEFNPKKDLEVNAESVLLMLEVCREKKFFPKIIFASSANIYGMAKKQPVDESFADNPLSLFSIHKLIAEKYLEFYAQEYKIPSVALRLSNLYGPVLNSQKTLRPLLNKIMKKALEGGPLFLFKNKNKLRDYLYIDDAVNAFLYVGSINDSKIFQRFIIGTGQKITFQKIINFISKEAAQIIGKKIVVNLDKESFVSEMEMRNFVADSSNFAKIYGWKAHDNITLGIKKTLEFLKNNT